MVIAVSTPVICDDNSSVIILPDTEIEVTVGPLTTPDTAKSDGFAEMSFTSSLIERLIDVVLLTPADTTSGEIPSEAVTGPPRSRLPKISTISPGEYVTTGVASVSRGVAMVIVIVVL